MKTLGLLIVLSLCISCSTKQKDNQATLQFKNDIDQVFGWVKNPTIIKGESHSGQFSTQVDSLKPYSYGFDEYLTTIVKSTSKKMTKITFSSWFKCNQEPKEVGLVGCIEVNGTNVVWNIAQAKKFVKNPGEWTLLSTEINIPPNLPDNAIVKVFGFSPIKETAWFDDFEISFE